MKDITNIKPILENPIDWHDIPLHGLCAVFPEMNGEDYDNLVSSMKIHGFLPSDPIVLINITPDAPDPEWEILDGRNRQMAATDALVEPSFVYYDGDNPIAFVVSRNLDRRHLTVGQKSAIASDLANLESGQNSKEGSITQAEAAKKVGVGEATIRRYKFVEKHDPELAAEVKKGTVPLEAARSAVKKELTKENALATAETVTNAIIKPTLGDKKAERRRSEKEAMTAFINDTIDRLVEVYEIGDSDKVRSAMIEAFTEGFTYCNRSK